MAADHPAENFKGGLKRLEKANYRGPVWIHWTMTVKDRATGWLTQSFHHALREAMLHTLVRYHLGCPVYCLMPDHAHFRWTGLRDDSDQLLATAFFRQEWNRLLSGVRSDLELQKQAYDHVLRERERERSEFECTAAYILENLVRRQLVKRFEEWPYSGAMMPGFPRLDPRTGDFWPRYWKVHQMLLA